MPIYNTYGSRVIPLRIGNLSFEHYDVMDSVNIPDGVYVCERGTVVVKDGVFIAEYSSGQILDSKGNAIKLM